MPTLREYLAIIPDFPNVLEKRMAVRPKHIDGFHALFEKGTITAGGGYAPDFSEPIDLQGSVLTVLAESKQQVLDLLSQDIYATSGVWDLKNAKIMAFYCAGRKAK